MECTKCMMYDEVEGCYGEPDEEGYCEEIWEEQEELYGQED